MSGPSPWLTFAVDVVTAIGTAAAAIVAVVIANMARKDAHDLRQEARRAEAARVTADARQMTRYVELQGANVVAGAYIVRIENGSTGPIYELSGTVSTQEGDESVSIGPLPLLGRGEMREVHTSPRPNMLNKEGLTVIRFRDAAEVWWERSSDGRVRELKASEVSATR